MTFPYFARLLCLCLASFFLAHAALAAAVSLAARRAIGRAVRMRARAGARLLLGLRLLPPTFAGLVVAGVCAPSYLWLEPEGSPERFGPACLVAALFGAAVCAGGLLRGAIAAIRSGRYLRRRQAAAEGDGPVLLMAGVFRPRLIVSRGVRLALTDDQLRAALRHEEAHGRTHDNLKRLLISIAPDALPFVRGFRSLDAGWRRLAEWAADDRAVEGSPERALALASALVRVGRMGAGVPLPPLATSLLADGGDLRARVERLIAPSPAYEPSPRLLLPGVAAAVLVASLALDPATLQAVHRALETLAH